jgi:hypothetical protein
MNNLFIQSKLKIIYYSLYIKIIVNNAKLVLQFRNNYLPIKRNL